MTLLFLMSKNQHQKNRRGKKTPICIDVTVVNTPTFPFCWACWISLRDWVQLSQLLYASFIRSSHPDDWWFQWEDSESPETQIRALLRTIVGLVAHGLVLVISCDWYFVSETLASKCCIICFGTIFSLQLDLKPRRGISTARSSDSGKRPKVFFVNLSQSQSIPNSREFRLLILRWLEKTFSPKA
jgi:hypothetical protein